MRLYNPAMATAPFPRKYQRLRGWDYSSAATYFITICAHNREHLFGEIVFAEVLLHHEGEWAVTCWDQTLALRPEIVPHAFVVMPNHVHALFSLNDNGGTHCDASLRSSSGFRRTPRSVATIIGGYKGAVTRSIRESLGDPDVQVWQSRYHDHIVRNQADFDRIATYIENNPAQWEQDRYSKPSP